MTSEIPPDILSTWQSLDPAVRSALIQSEQANDTTTPSASGTATSEGIQGRRAKASTGPRISDDSNKFIGGNSFIQRTPNPSWISVRSEVYDAIKSRRDAELSTKVPVEITVTLPDGTTLSQDKEGTVYKAWITTPFDVAATISRGLADSACVARVTYSEYVADYDLEEDGMGGVDTLADSMAELSVNENNNADGSNGGVDASKTVLWDMTRPLVGSVSKMEFLKFEDDTDARTVFWHSSAHVMGEALERLFGSRLTIGPPLAGGFYYDSYMGEGGSDGAFKEEDCE